MKSIRFRLIELFSLFIILPILFSLSFDIIVKLGIGLLAFLYVIWILLKVEGVKLNLSETINWKQFLKTTSLKLIVVVIASTLFVWFFYKESFFHVVADTPDIWIKFLFIYTIISVFPQELVYRTFFFKRYKILINNNSLFQFINAVIFSLGHIFFKNPLVIGLTFIGGLVFATTYNKHRSTILVTLEHSIYGCWLFTVGLGKMLGFPL